MSFSERHRLLVLFIITSVLVFCACAIIRTAPFSPYDNAWMQETMRFDYVSVTAFMLALSTVLGPVVLSILSLLLVVALWIEKQFRWMFFFLFSMACTLVSIEVLKVLFAVARPVSTFVVQTGYSFPSGHAAVASAFFFSLIYAVEKTAHDAAVMTLVFISSIGFMLAVGLSRTYLEVHLMTDVIAGFALGAFWVGLAVLLFRSRTFESLPT